MGSSVQVAFEARGIEILNGGSWYTITARKNPVCVVEPMLQVHDVDVHGRQPILDSPVHVDDVDGHLDHVCVGARDKPIYESPCKGV